MDSAFVQMPLTDSITWVKFTATGSFVDVVLIDPSDTLNGRINLMTLYRGACSSLTSSGSASYWPGQDSIISLVNAGITSGTTYLIKLIKPIRGIHDASRYFYIGAFSNPIPPINQGSPRGVHNSGHNLGDSCHPNSCDIVSNGNFEVSNATCTQMAATNYGVIIEYDERNSDGYSDVSCWWCTDVGSKYFNSCYQDMGCGSGYYVPKNLGGCNIQDHSKAEGWTGPNFGYCGIIVDAVYAQDTVYPYNIIPDWYDREYLLQQLSNPMIAGATYNVSFWVQLEPFSNGEITAGDMGMFLSPHEPYGWNNDQVWDQMDSGTGHVAVPQITGAASALCPTCGCSPTFNKDTTWVNITGKYTATGHEKFIEIGNFRKDSAHTVFDMSATDVSGYFIDDVSITPYLTASATPSFICSHFIAPTATLSASGGFSTYTWLPGSLSGQTVSVHPPTGTTTYTVIASYGGSCKSDTATVTVTVDPTLTDSISVSGDICVGTPVSVKASGGTSPYTYNWSPGGLTTATLSPVLSGTYTVNITDALGCSLSASTFTVDSDCCYLSLSCSNPVVIPSGSSSHSYTTADFTNNNCINISGPGTFTISSSFTITNCDIAMGDGATIDVPYGVTLTIDNSRLYACGNMWQGIKVEYGGNLRIIGSSASSPCIVEDAIYGVYLEGTATISYGLLNNNLYDVYVNGEGVNTLTSLDLVASTLTCQSDPGYSSNAYLKTPHLGAITNSGVYITSFPIPGDITVGNNSSPSYRNTFSNMNYGVNANNAGIQVVNNLFENLQGPATACMASILNGYSYCPPPIGIAVLGNNVVAASGSGYSIIYYPMEIGYNTMQECYRGVDVTNYLLPIITHNEIYNTANQWSFPHSNPYPYGDHGIYLKNIGIPDVAYDTITNFYTGIHLNGFIMGSTYFAGSGIVSDNKIIATGSSTGLMTSGIIAEGSGQGVNYDTSRLSYNTIFQVDHNVVSDAGTSCITLNSLKPAYPFFLSVDTNNLTILPSTSQSNRTQRSGIYLEHVQVATAYDNTISATGTYTLNPAGSKPADTSVIGIRAVLNNTTIYECNSITQVGECMMYEGPNFPSKIYYNYMADAYNAFVYESSGEVGIQGSATNPIGDDWQGPFSNYYTYTLNSFASSSPLYVINNTNQNPAYYAANNTTYDVFTGDKYVYNTNVFSATGTIPSCPTGCTNCTFSTERPQYRTIAQKIVDDSLPYSMFIDESKYLGQQAVYNEISYDTTMMDSSTILRNFYNYTSGTADTSNHIGQLYTVSMDIAKGNYTAASSLNSSIIPVNLIEQNQQLVNYIYLNTVAAGVDTATVVDYNALAGIAIQCPLEGGDAVFQARGLLNLLFNTSFIVNDSCLNDSSSGHAPNKKSTTAKNPLVYNINANVYPNPANTLLNVEVGLHTGQIAYFEMYNSLGQEIKSIELDNNLTTLSTINLPAGMYYYRIIDKNGNIIKADKQLLIH